jgi:hypothetical protein
MGGRSANLLGFGSIQAPAFAGATALDFANLLASKFEWVLPWLQPNGLRPSYGQVSFAGALPLECVCAVASNSKL